ncbi:MAG TPA: transketolase [Bacteroidales bacterium]|nr:transketolase [Clostridiales bacterium]HHV03232.1 transketolase [Bacteroidales bacterium]
MNYEQLREFAKQIRINTVECIGSLGVGHIGGSLSIADVLAVLYGKHMNVNPKEPKMEGRDRLVCSKGHAGPAIYAVLAEKGYFPKSELLTLNQGGTNLPSHCDMNKTIGVDMTAGSLGQGLSAAVGIAIGAKLRKDGATSYAIIGDGESQEGQIWEAAMYAGHMKLDNLIVFTDFNKLQLDGEVEKINDIEPLVDKWRSFNWEVIEVADGNNVEAIDKAITKAKSVKGKPKMIILHTVKGKGVSFVEKAWVGSHSMSIDAEKVAIAVKEIRGA